MNLGRSIKSNRPTKHKQLFYLVLRKFDEMFRHVEFQLRDMSIKKVVKSFTELLVNFSRYIMVNELSGLPFGLKSHA